MKFSIVTPSYNQGRFIGRTIESVLSQHGDFDLEYIVVDGGSKDETLDILRSYGTRLRWVSERDEGQTDALNKGLAMASGDVIGWVNSDDAFLPGCLEAVRGVFQREPRTQWLYGKVRIIDAEDREIRRWITWYKNLRMRRFDYAKLLTEDWIPQMGVFWRRAAGEAVGPFRKELQHAMDYDYWLRLGARWEGRFVDEYLAAFRWYETSKSGSAYVDQTAEALAVARENAGNRYPASIFWHRVNRMKIITAYRVLDAVNWRRAA